MLKVIRVTGVCAGVTNKTRFRDATVARTTKLGLKFRTELVEGRMAFSLFLFCKLRVVEVLTEYGVHIVFAAKDRW